MARGPSFSRVSPTPACNSLGPVSYGSDVEPDIRVAGLAKTFRVPEREGGLRASLRSLVRRTTRDVVAVAGIDFAVQPGEVVGFLGPNGAGKTTTLKMLSGLLFPSAGDVRVLGHVPSRREHAFLRRVHR